MATILIVDDLSANRDFLAAVLSSQGHKLIHAADGAEALSAARRELPDLIITDVLMPRMDGYELFRQVRLDPATCAIPVIFYTAHYAEREAADLALSNGVSYVLSKTSSTTEVMETVDAVLSRDAGDCSAASEGAVRDSFNRDHLKLLSDMLSEKTGDLREANARLRAIINIGLEFASDRDSKLKLDTVCRSVRDLFSASYAALGFIESDGRTILRSYCAGPGMPRSDETEAAIQEILATASAERQTLRSEKKVVNARTSELQSFLLAPIATPAHLYGWMCLVKSDGSEFPPEDQQLVQALAGQIGRIHDLDFQICERKRIEETLRDERDRAQLYLDTAEVLLLGTDLDARITMINRFGCNLLGWTESELIGKNWIDTCLPERIRTDIKAKLTSLHAGEIPAFFNPVLTRSGEERTIEWHNTVIYDEMGEVTGLLSSGNDITVESNALKHLTAAEERTRFVLMNTNIGIWDMNFPTGVLEWSEVLQSQYGFAPGTFPGTFDAFAEAIHPLDRDEVVGIIQERIRTGGDFAMTHRVLWRDGTVRWVSGAGRVYIDEHGVASRGVGISRDITDQRTADERTQQGQRLEAIGQLASGVAHDFNNLLTVIMGFAELMAADSTIEGQHEEDLGEIIKATQRAAALTGQLLAFSRQQVLNPAALDLNGLISGMGGMLTRLIGADIEVSLSLSPDLELALADKGQMEQVVMNLVVNARDAMPRGGKLHISTANVKLENSSFHAQPMEEGEYVMFSVADTGDGMTRETQERVFEPFFTTKLTGKGTGLGLSTTYGIVKQSKGYIWVYSEPGLGARFNVYLPCAPSTSATSALRATPPRARRSVSETLLLVEDEAGVREFSRRTLTDAGYIVLEASNGDEAEEIFGKNASLIAMVVTDVVMPNCGGPELLERLWVTSPELKVLYMSGYADRTAVTEMELGGALTFLQKPFRAADLLGHVRDVLDQERLAVS